MSLGPSFARLAARNPGFFDDISSKLTELTNNAKAAADPLPQVGEVSGSTVVPIHGGIAGPFNAGAYNDNFYKRSNAAGGEETSGELPQVGSGLSGFSTSGVGVLGSLMSGIFQPEKYLEGYPKREETSILKLPGLSLPTDVLGAAEFDPDVYYRQFLKRDSGNLTLSKTYQKLHRALKAIAVGELD